MKPGKGQFQIDYRSGEAYEPDFVVEARTGTLICEVKSETEMNDPVVQAIVLVMALAVLLSNLVADVLYGVVDPRVAYN